ncbi:MULTISPECIES: hypothetical protein [unclassified Mesorhizobium]|uniref:hypothetical protein n=1 Tax=unclassified Mesorhizobium TaxID=325217 RepID=UPI000BAFDA66|nr:MULTISPECIES: hypothetical protein [unclassified Mesorhizobium]PBB23281.1 hypothetical protein CK232_28650 [Mesorhizobium sp. WSM4304]PBB71851.1 hypothetical protein CK227_29930 [Mesorhizobium sp. WSM4308]
MAKSARKASGDAQITAEIIDIQTKEPWMPDAAFDWHARQLAPDTEPTSRFHDAEIWGEMSPEVAALPIAVSVAENRFEKEWKPVPEAPFKAVFEGMFAQHKIGKKEGRCFVTGTLGQSKRRTKNNVLKNYMMGIDVDSGASLEDCFQKVRNAGLTCIFYSTHSHGSTGIEIAQDRFHRWAEKSQIDTTPTTESIRRYLREETPYVDDVVDAAEFIEKRQDDGMKLIIQTRPIDKFRMIFPLAVPFVYTEQDGAHKDVINLWSQKVLGLGRSFGIDPDPAARDPSRLFYLPRHSKDHHNYRVMLTCGRLIKFEDIPSAGSAKVSSDPFDQAAYIMGATARRQIVSPTLGMELRQWARDRSHGFDIAQVFRDYCDDKIRTEQSDSKLTIECPFDDDHSNPGDPDDQGCFVQSAGADAETFSFHCSHAGCAGRDRLTHMQKAMQDGWFPDSILTDPTYDLAGIDDEGDGITQHGFDALLKRAVAERADGGVIGAATKDALIECCASGRAPSNAMELLKARAKIGATEFGKKVADRKKELRKERKNDRAKGTIYASDDFDVQCEALESALLQRNDNEPSLYNFGGAASRLIETVDDKGPRMVLAPMNRDEFESECNDTLTFVFDLTDGEYRKEALPLVVVKKTWNMAIRDYLLPLRRIVATPIHAANGSLCQTAGYARDVCALVDIGPLTIPPVSDCPTPEELGRAKNLILIDFLGDWCFADDFGGEPRDGIASKAHAVALLLQHFARELYTGCTPGFLIDKPAPGTGATYLVDMIHRVAHGRSAAAEAFPETEDEVRKGTTAKLRAGVSMIFYDNVRRKFGGNAVAALLTAESWRDRILGETRIAEYPNLGVMVVTANNASISDELVRRLLPIRLDARIPEAALEDRTFSKPDLSGWVMENRGELVWACLTLIQNWIAKGQHPARQGFKSYESFAKVMGGILGAAGIRGFMQNVDAFRASKKVENLEDVDLMQALFDGLQTKDADANVPALTGFTAADAHDIAFEQSGVCKFAGLAITADRDDEHLQNRVLGTRLEKRLNSYRLAGGDYRFEKAGTRDGSNVYRFALIRANGAPEPA